MSRMDIFLNIEISIYEVLLYMIYDLSNKNNWLDFRRLPQTSQKISSNLKKVLLIWYFIVEMIEISMVQLDM
uniref:Uncharacterized protein n=1 Tax=viral metagenome TaxID=1070528 RepID=A0A6M3JUM9_9ZZZZ